MQVSKYSSIDTWTHQKPNLSEISDQLKTPSIPLISAIRYDELSTLFAKSIAQNATHHASGAKHGGHTAAKRRSAAGSTRRSSRV